MYLVDASVYIFRAWFSLPDTLRGRDDRPLNAVYGFADFLGALLATTGGAPVAVAYDESLESSFRNELYPAYKANREPAPPELKQQMRDCQRLTRALGLATVVSDRYEADDLIGTLATRSSTPVVLVSSDKDLAQLLGPDDRLWDYARDVLYDPAAIRAKYGVDCDQMVDYLALMGDSVDNIPGVAGIGAKTAARLLQARGSLDAIYADLDAVAALPIRGAAGLAKNLAAGRESAFMSRELARIVTDVPLEKTDLAPGAAQPQALTALCEAWGVSGERRARWLAAGGQAP